MFTKKEFPDVKTAVKRVKFEKFAVGDASGRGVLCGTGGGNCDCSGGKIAPCVGLTDYLLPSGGNPSIPNPHDPPAVFALLPGTDENGERTERVAFVSKRGLAYLYNDTRQEFEYAMRVFDSTPKILPVYAADGGAKLAFCSSEGILLFDGDSKFSSVYARGSDAACVFHERLFFAEKPFTLRYSAPLDASMFADSADEGGYIRLPSTGGEIVGLEEWKESIYIFRERGIEKLNAKGAARDFSHETLSYGGGKIFGRSIGKCGKNILFLAEDGVYAFDGSEARRSCTELSVRPIAGGQGIEHGSFAGRYFLRYPDADGETKLLIQDEATEKAYFAFASAQGISETEKGLLCFSDQKLRMFAVNGSLPAGEVCSFCAENTDFGVGGRKLWKTLRLKRRGSCLIETENESETKAFEVTFERGEARAEPFLKGENFSLKMILGENSFVSGAEMEFVLIG